MERRKSLSAEGSAEALKGCYQRYVAERLDSRHDFLRSPLSYLRLWKKAFLDANLRNMAARLEKLRGSYSGNRCFLVGNGPSLNDMDLDLFKEEYTWCSNRCNLFFDRISWRPSFYSAVDVRVVPDIADEIAAMVRELSSTLFFLPALFSLNKDLKSEPNLYWYREKALRKDLGPGGMFSKNAARYVYSVKSVTIAAMQLAVFLGFNPIYLIGCDTSYSIPASVKNEDEESEKLISTEDDDLNHFDCSYFGKGRKWHDPHPDMMIYHYRHAKLICDEMGVKVYNATVGGKLEVFPRVDYRDVLK